LAQLPWIGPILGETFSPDGEPLVRIGGAADPLLGKALAAVFVPVVRDAKDQHFVPSDQHGEPQDVVKVGWVASFKSDKNGRFRIDAPAGRWEGGIAGVLMILLYDQSDLLYDPSSGKSGDRLFPDTWRAQLEKLSSGSLRLDDNRPTPISDLPEAIKTEIERRIEKLLKESIKELEPGLIELDRREARRHPQPQPPEITFAVASCQYPAGFLDRDIAEYSYRRLARCLDRKDTQVRPKCLLLLGDQIYVDATAGLFDPTSKYDRFELPYERLLRIAPLRQVLRRLPTYTMLDDHEIEDNWEPVAGDNRTDQNMIEGRRSYLGYQRMAGPDQTNPGSDSKEPLWYAFEVNGFPFFMADTRTERSPRTAETIESARIMSVDQFGTLLDWLDERKTYDIPKFIASPACFLPRHLRATQHGCPASALRSDAWDGYPHSLHRLLAFIADNSIRNVIFLSGDEHLSFVARARIRADASGGSALIYSIHSSALHAPFPFANSIQANLAGQETFKFELPLGNSGECPGGVSRGGTYACEVSTEFAAPGDGFAVLQVLCKNGEWRVKCRFVRGRRPKTARKWIDVLNLK
jgi:hypothetical protein